MKNQIKNIKSRILNNTSGQGLTEYLILLVLVAVAAIGVSKSLGKAVTSRIGLATKEIASLKVTQSPYDKSGGGYGGGSKDDGDDSDSKSGRSWMDRAGGVLDAGLDIADYFKRK